MEKAGKKNLKILLIVPKYSDNLDFNSALENLNYNYSFPLGLGYIATAIKKEGYSLSVLNMNHHKGTLSQVLFNGLNKQKYDIVATGHTAMGFSVVKKIVRGAKRHPSKPKIILGGSLITSEKELMFKTLSPDYAVYGEGEITIVKLLRCIENKKDLNKVKGIIFRDRKGKIIITPPRELIKNIDEIPFPDFEGLGFGDYINNQLTNTVYYQNCYDNPRPLHILASRSCPFQCTFCYHSLGTGYRERSIKNVLAEIEFMIKKHNINILCINDDLFSAREERLMEFCRGIEKINKERGQKIKWTCQLAVKTVNNNLLKTLKKAGCEIISYGFESFSEKVLKSMKKPIAPREIDLAFKSTIKEKMGIQANFIFGDPAETIETSKKTLNYWKNECKGQVVLGFIQPYPKSEIYTHCISKGIIKDKLDYIENGMTSNKIINMTNSMSEGDIKNLSHKVNKLKNKHYSFVVPKSITLKGKNYSVKIKCPFCNKRIVYKNYFLQSRLMYATNGLVCRSCNMRSNVISPLLFLLIKFHLLSLIEKTYFKVKKIRSNSVK